ncbi:unnamed protein product (macronuclear) [Paramecium tetraurelia]|uniref:IQ calmodulin-binding motif family protein n=1 Tax=Paramecium tetraurelia TaxID=5888 RepID=A0DNW8_PARTE|nr:uncharacterized protein GSPATT00018931001 [Paramecium tetraurelia]CAK84735.1 unnamed protein product [Paramecium tetraurelia]|eukprot:XP_001452132.1 hypothetical protein (macronuclear) [Paramecium tetraurelia strain d4-2]
MFNKRQLLKNIVDLYYQQVEQMETNYDIDNKYATKIQSYYRMYVLHKAYKKNQNATITIQKYCRAYLARQLVKQKLSECKNRRNVSTILIFHQIIYLSNQAQTIQRYFRGYIYRKYVHDFYLRKKQLELMNIKNQNFLQELRSKAEQEKEEEKIRHEQAAKQEFMKLATNLHHLTSTKSQPGIFKPPFAKENPKAFDIEVETQLKIAFQTNVQWKTQKRSGSAQRAVTSQGFRIRPQSQKLK